MHGFHLIQRARLGVVAHCHPFFSARQRIARHRNGGQRTAKTFGLSIGNSRFSEALLSFMAKQGIAKHRNALHGKAKIFGKRLAFYRSSFEFQVQRTATQGIAAQRSAFKSNALNTWQRVFFRSL